MSEEFDAYRKWLGIPPGDQPPHHYRLLGIAPFEDDPDVIENAASRQMAHVRTFQSGKHSRLSQQLLNELSSAKVCLLNPAKKTGYDAALRARLDGVTNVEIVGDIDPVAPPPTQGGVQVVAAPVASSTSPVFNFGAAPSTVVVGSKSRPARGGASSRAARAKSRSNLLPIILLIVCALVLVAVIAAVMNLDVLKKLSGGSGDAKPVKRDTSTAPTSTEKPEKKPSPKSGDKPSKSDKSGEGFEAHPVIPPPPSRPSKAVSEVEFKRAIAETRRALGKGELESANRFLGEADHYKTTEKDQAEVLHLRTLAGYLGDFWHNVRQGVYAVQPGQPFEFRNSKYELVQREGDLVTYKAAGEQHETHVRALEPKAALAFALQKPEEKKGRAAFLAATFLTFDDRGGEKQHQQMQEQARRLWHEAARHGIKDADLAVELGINPAAEPLPDTGEP